MRILKLFVGAGCVVAILAACLVVMSTLSGFAQTDPIIGTWKLNLANSKYSPGPPPKSQMLTYEAVGQGVKVTVKGADAEGKPIDFQYTANYDGKDYTVTGNPNYDAITLKRIDAYKVESTRKKGGKVVSTSTRIISKDGRTLTITTKGVNAKGEKIGSATVYEKQLDQKVEGYKANLIKSLPSPGISSPFDEEEINALVTENFQREKALEAAREQLRKRGNEEALVAAREQLQARDHIDAGVTLARATNDIDVYLDHLELPPQPPPPETPSLTGTPSSQYDSDNVCVTKSFHAGKRAVDLAALAPNSSTLWPGSIVGGHSLAGGLLSPITLPRGRGRVTLLNTAGAGTSQTISIRNPSLGAINDAATRMKNSAFPTGVPAFAGGLMTETYHSVDEAAMRLDVQASWLQGNVRDTLDISHSRKRSHVVVSLVQAYYDLVFEEPAIPSAMFKSGIIGGVSLKDLQDALGPNAVKPAYVSTIRYGRMILMRASSDAEASDLKNAVHLAMSGLGASGQIDQTLRNNQTIQSTEFQLVVLGSQDSTSTLVSGFEGLEHIQEIWAKGATLPPGQPAVPVSYQVRWLGRSTPMGDRYETAKMTFVSDYSEVTCSPQRIVRFGANFHTTDDDKDGGDQVIIDLLKGSEVLSTYWCDKPYNHEWGDGVTTPEPNDGDFGGVKGYYSTTNFNRDVFSNEIGQLKLRVRKSGDRGWHFNVTCTLWLESGRKFELVVPVTRQNEFGGDHQVVVLP